MEFHEMKFEYKQRLQIENYKFMKTSFKSV